jgi:hypothetical protein
MVLEMEDRFKSDYMYEQRCRASSALLREHRALLREHRRDDSTPRFSGEEETAIRAVLNHLEKLAHFTNHGQINKDMTLNTFHLTMKMYYSSAEKCYLPHARDPSGAPPGDPQLWKELETLCGEIDKWHEEERGAEGPAEMYKPYSLLERLEKEHEACEHRTKERQIPSPRAT